MLDESSGPDARAIAIATSPDDEATRLTWADGVSAREQAAANIAARIGSRRARACSMNVWKRGSADGTER
jgi:hypothetical protein